MPGAQLYLKTPVRTCSTATDNGSRFAEGQKGPWSTQEATTNLKRFNLAIQRLRLDARACREA